MTQPSPLPDRRTGMGLLYAVVVLASLACAALQPGHAEAAGDASALLELAVWADEAAGSPSGAGPTATSAP